MSRPFRFYNTSFLPSHIYDLSESGFSIIYKNAVEEVTGQFQLRPVDKSDGLKPTVLIYRCLMRHIIRSPDRFFPNVRQNIFIAPSPALCANHRTPTSSWRHMQPVILVQKAKESSSCVFVWIQTAAQQKSRRPIINSVCRTEFVWKVRGRSVPSPCKSSNVSELVVWQKGVSL